MRPCPARFARDQSGRRHFGSRVIALHPARKATNHAEPRGPSVVVRRAKSILPAQEQADGDMICAFPISERGEAAQNTAREREIVAEAAANREILIETLRQRAS